MRSRPGVRLRNTARSSLGRGFGCRELPADLLEGAFAVHRADLQTALADAAGGVLLGVEVTAVEQEGDSVLARGADGTEERADLLVGADGINSRVRASFIDTAVRYAGYVSWRGISPVTIKAGSFTESWGAGERFGLVDIGGRTYWFATKNAPAGGSDEARGRKAEVMRRFAGWHDPIAQVIEASDEAAILRNDVHYLDSPRVWSNRRVVLLGDAAHATTPGVGQGAAMAIEDAVVLSDRLPLEGDPAGTLAEYEAIRRPRAEGALKMSRRADRLAQLSNPVGRRLRNGAVRLIPAGAQRRQLEPLVRHRL